MLIVELDEANGIAFLEPGEKLSKSDFISAAQIIDPYIETAGRLKGLIVHAKSFSGWDSFSSLITHLKFVKSHHKKILRVAFVTDSRLGSFAEHVASHFVNAQIQHFKFDELEASREWILEPRKTPEAV